MFVADVYDGVSRFLIRSLDQAAFEERFPRLDEIPFSSERRRMTTLHQWTGMPVA
jgi:magnesium-transporting ATPase (P-type)